MAYLFKGSQQRNPRYLDLHGVILEIDAFPEELSALIYAHLDSGPGSWITASEPELKCCIELTEREFPESPGNDALFFHYSGLHGYYQGDQILFATESSRFEWDPASMRLVGQCHSRALDDPIEFVNTVFSNIICECLRNCGLYFVHSAACCRPDGAEFLFPAQSECGKTTTTVSLLNNGWKVVSDDAIFLKADTEGVRVLPFRTEFHLPYRVWSDDARLSYLESAQGYGRKLDKRTIPAEELYPGQVMECLESPRYMIFPSIVDAEVSELRPMSSGESIHLLLRESPYVMFSRREEDARYSLDIIKSILGQVDCYQLLAGRDALADTGIVPSLLEALP